MTINDIVGEADSHSIARVRAKYNSRKRYFETQEPTHYYRCKAEVYIRMREVEVEDGWFRNKLISYDFSSNRRHLCYGIKPVFDQEKQEIVIAEQHDTKKQFSKARQKNASSNITTT